jgi:hypothetical protein
LRDAPPLHWTTAAERLLGSEWSSARPAASERPYVMPALPDRLSPAEEKYLRSLLSIPNGVLQRRAIRTRRITGALFIVCLLGIVFGVAKFSASMTVATLGLVAGASAAFWMIARSTAFRAPVLMRICDWQHAEALLMKRPDA